MLPINSRVGREELESHRMLFSRTLVSLTAACCGPMPLVFFPSAACAVPLPQPRPCGGIFGSMCFTSSLFSLFFVTLKCRRWILYTWRVRMTPRAIYFVYFFFPFFSVACTDLGVQNHVSIHTPTMG